MFIRDRIKELRRVPAKTLLPNPRNWRRHPPHQQAALQGILAEIGYADALIARELSDGSLELIDGHLRAEITPASLVPVLVLDVDAAEAAKLLAALDPLASLAETDQGQIAGLLAEIETESPALRQMFDELAAEKLMETAADTPDTTRENFIPASWQVVVQCADEAQQREVYEQFCAQGMKCRLLTM